MTHVVRIQSRYAEDDGKQAWAIQLTEESLIEVIAIVHKHSCLLLKVIHNDHEDVPAYTGTKCFFPQLSFQVFDPQEGEFVNNDSIDHLEWFVWYDAVPDEPRAWYVSKNNHFDKHWEIISQPKPKY